MKFLLKNINNTVVLLGIKEIKLRDDVIIDKETCNYDAVFNYYEVTFTDFIEVVKRGRFHNDDIFENKNGIIYVTLVSKNSRETYSFSSSQLIIREGIDKFILEFDDEESARLWAVVSGGEYVEF